MNGLQFELSAEQLGGDADLTNVTFSFGTIANNDSFANCLTLVSINGKNLASEPTPPEEPDVPSKPEEPDDPNEPEKPGTERPEKPEEPAPKKKKCGSTVSGTSAAIAAALMLCGAAIVTVRGKKKNAK